MTFLTPLFLLAAAAVAIPVVLHLINRQRVKDLPFSTLRFLKISVQKTRQRRRIHDLLLMLVRAAVLLLIALGLARPTLTSLKSLLGGGASSAVVILLDNSASMGVIDQNKPRFETALAAAQQILDEVPEGEQVGLLLTSGPPAFPDVGKLHRSRSPVQQILRQCAVSYERADLGLRLQQARKLLAGSDAANKQIYVLTDQQRHSWDSLKKDEEAATGEEEKKAQEAPVIVVDCDRAPKPNQAIQGIDLEATVPVAGMPIKATVELFNAATVDMARHIELYIDDTKEATSSELNVPAQGRVTYAFQFAFKRGGLHRGEVRLVGEDGSPYDDRRFFTMEVDQGIPVAVVGPQRHEIAYLDDTFYVERALSPRRDGAWAIRTTVLSAKDLLGEPLTNYTVIYLVNLPALESDAAERLRSYVENGGHVVWICGENVQPEAYNQMNQQAKGGLLPGPLLEVRTAGPQQGRDSWPIGFLDKKHPALGHLVEPASLYQSVLVYKHARVDAAAATGARILARLDDGEPLLLQRKAGRGSVTFLGTSAHVGWTNLPLRPIFLPLLARLTFELAGAEQARRSAIAGSPIVLNFDQENRPLTVEVIPPSGSQNRLPTKGQDGQAGQSFRYAETHDIGIYTLRLLEGTKPAQVAYAINIDPDEALPAKIEPEDLKERLSPADVVFAEDPEDLSNTFKLLREGKNLWQLFLTGVLVALVFETFVSNRLSPKQEDNPELAIPPGMRRLGKQRIGARV